MQSLMLILLILLLLSLIALWVSFAGSLILTSRYELKKKAQAGDKEAKIVYGLTSSGREIFVAILLGVLLAVALLTVLLDSVLWSVLAAVLAALLVAVAGVIMPFVYGEKLGLKLTARLAPVASKLLFILRPIARPLGKMLDAKIGKNSLLYSKEQLLNIIDDHTKSPYADISSDEAVLVRHSLQFGDKLIRDVMVPRKIVDTISVLEQVGPVFMDELHKSGHSRFPVFDPVKNDEIVGVLYLHALIGAKKSGSVKSLMNPKVFFVHEELDLNHALNAFIKTKHHLFVVVDNFGEFVGIITIEDILEQILGRQIVDEFDNYENLRAVAELRAKKARATEKNVVK